MILYFSTPAFQRYALSDICFEQRRWAIERLAEAGIEARCVVVADDDNVDVALKHGFEVRRRDNEWLGRRFNDGYEHAADEGATHVFPIGSDSWVDPQFIVDAERRGDFDDDNNDGYNVVSSRHYTRINATGTIRRQLWVPVQQGVSFVVPVKALRRCDFRPCHDQISRGCDGSAWQTITRTAPVAVVWSESNTLETTAFESNGPQITRFDKLDRWGVGDEVEDVFGGLRATYPDSIVDRIESFYEGLRSIAVVVEDVDVRVKQITSQVLNDGRVGTKIRQHAKPLIERAVRIALTER